MGYCTDRSARYLRDLGYNVVRHPAAGLEPLHIFGRIGGVPARLGGLADIVDQPQAAYPAIIPDIAAANINGEQTSRLPVSVGLDILGAVMTGLGGNLGVTAQFESARTLQFQFNDVTKSLVNLADIGRYLDSGAVRWEAMGIREFLSPGGALYVVTETAQSTSFGVSAFRSRSARIDLDVPAIQGLLGSGSVTAALDTTGKTQVAFEGGVPLVFGFKCVELAVTEHPDDPDELRLSFKPTRPGEVALSLGDIGEDAVDKVFFSESGVIDDLPAAP